MEIVNKIGTWAGNQPLWQQVAIADILKGKDIAEETIARYADIALQEVTDPEGVIQEVGNPLEDYNYTAKESSSSVAIAGILDTVNVNDISDGSALTFNTGGLNIIFGNNAAGKSGYTRVLKSACMSRGAEAVQGSIWRKDGRDTGAKIAFQVDGVDDSLDWSNGAAANLHLKTIHVFDSMSGSTYLSRSTDIKYKPAGMDILDTLITIIQKVTDKLDNDRTGKSLQLTDLSQLFSDFEGTKAQVLIDALDKKGAAERLDEIIVISDNEEADIVQLEKNLPERERQAPAKYRENLVRATNRLDRINTLAGGVRKTFNKVDQEAISKAIGLKTDAEKIANKAKKAKFDDVNFLDGTGGDLWNIMWSAAESFASECAYPEHAFPHTKDGAKCPLCQQELLKDAVSRFEEFSKHVKDKSQENATTRKRELQQLVEAFEDANQSDNEVEALFADVSADDFAGIDEVRAAVDTLRAKHVKYAAAIAEGKPIIEDADFRQVDLVIEELSKRINRSRSEIAKPLDDQKYNLELANDKNKLKGLKARKLLVANEKAIRTNIDTHIALAAHTAARSKCNTTPISLYSGRLSNDHIIEPLKNSFNTELSKIFSGKVKAELVAGSTRQGVPHSEIVLSADGAHSREKIEGIMSEGEQRGLALAGFFTELSIMPNKSAIIFDDPITSMDDENAAKIAKRLVEASIERQVVVFTHRVSFVSQLIDEAKNQGSIPETKTVSRMSRPGVVEPRMPWDSMKVGDRISWLRNRLQSQLQPLHRDGNAEEYERVAEHFYSKLRETWERAIEERLFGNVVKRHSRNVSTQQMRHVTYREADDAIIEENMTKCSNYMHDGTGDSVEPIPPVDVINQDLKSLEDWLEELKGRRI